jgi:hypothetical protein
MTQLKMNRKERKMRNAVMDWTLLMLLIGSY